MELVYLGLSFQIRKKFLSGPLAHHLYMRWIRWSPKVLANANIVSILYHLPSDYYVLDSILSTLHTQSHWILKQLNEEASITFHSQLKMRKLQLREEIYLHSWQTAKLWLELICLWGRPSSRFHRVLSLVCLICKTIRSSLHFWPDSPH